MLINCFSVHTSTGLIDNMSTTTAVAAAKMTSTTAVAASLVLSGCVIANAFRQKKQFYPSVVYICKSNPSMAVSNFSKYINIMIYNYYFIHFGNYTNRCGKKFKLIYT